MLIHVRQIAITMAVTAFFGLSIVGLFTGLEPLTCCKRAFLGATLIYIVTGIIVHIVNAVLMRAIIDSHINKNKGT
jgi:uncharacterized membrane protein YjjP (DUF1212 family)